MKSALGNTFIVNFIIIFTIIFIALFVGSTSYTKAMRIKNRIIDIIEENQGYDYDELKDEINNYLKDAGYRIATTNAGNCEPVNSGGTVVYPSQTQSSQYDYCIFEYNSKRGKYYGVKTYMYLDLPIIGDTVKIGVYGETSVMGIFD